jgi:phosphate transport system ATP-binding protein
MSAIITEAFSCYYQARQILHEITMTIVPHQITAIIGASGCGKSTFLKSLNRIAELEGKFRTTGTVRINQQNIYDDRINLNDLRRRVGMVFQKPAPFPMGIFANVAYGIRNLPKAQLAERVEIALQQAFLWQEVKDRLSQPALSLSGGQQQRLCIARALAVQPEILLMDEPCSALDPRSTQQIEELILAIYKKITIVIVTHNLAQAQRIAHCTALFHSDRTGRGTLLEYADTTQLFQNPQQQETRDFVQGRIG